MAKCVHLYLLVLWLLGVLSVVQGQEDIYVQGMTPESGGWANGVITRFVSKIALEHVNVRPDVLPGYKLNILWEDSQCTGGIATFKLCNTFHTPPTKLMLMGDSCSGASKAMAQMIHLYNVTEISPDSVSPVLSDKVLYPNFFRMWPPATININPWLAILRHFNWDRVALLYTTLSDFSMVMQRMVTEMAKHNVSLVTAEVFQHDPTDRIPNLKKHDAKIIIVYSYELQAAKAMCAAYKHGLMAPKVVWIFPGWYNSEWFVTFKTDCSEEEMRQVTSDILYTSVINENDDPDQVGVSGYSSRELEVIFNDRREREGFGEIYAYHERFYFYDTVWAIALTLNATQEELSRSGEKRLTDFTYSDGEMGEIIRSKMASLQFQGQRGFIKFDENGDPTSNLKIEQEREVGRALVAFYKMGDTEEFQLFWQDDIVWSGGVIPSDSTVIKIKREFMNSTVYLSLCAVASIGIALTLVFLMFNVTFRKKREIKMSSPNMNNIILSGSIFCYFTIFFNAQREEDARLYCIIWPISLVLGMSLTMGALLSKTWRVHAIFRNKTAMNVNIQDNQLIGMVVALVVVNLAIIVIWELVDPYTVIYINTSSESVNEGGQGVTLQYQVSICYSYYSIYFSGALYLVQGLQLMLGAFLAWETRKVKVEALNDSQLIGTCIYNVFILSLLGVGLSVALKHETLLVSTLTSIFLLVATFSTESVIFLPKILKVVRGQADVMPSTLTAAGTLSTTAKDEKSI